MLTPEILLAAGYTKFLDTSSAERLGDWYNASYQKRFRDEHGTRFFITIRHYTVPAINGNPSQEGFTSENQFNKDGSTFDLQMHYNGETLEQIEAFFADL